MEKTPIDRKKIIVGKKFNPRRMLFTLSEDDSASTSFSSWKSPKNPIRTIYLKIYLSQMKPIFPFWNSDCSRVIEAVKPSFLRLGVSQPALFEITGPKNGHPWLSWLDDFNNYASLKGEVSRILNQLSYFTVSVLRFSIGRRS
ncbi:unnamed protein product [Lepeophtheirus salmonis]|uniref:(salmon louse) hypothetical protein n=1 Tax=Lepeophtheirus salmonis TaxID=72036 RepID=A0A7R8CHB4_LEPSM|nr:unnamed protein product [Lepeophtheirus salmonis]CAF2817602.1 unnamed protein product [Lepeophtheirus salmonis]